MSTPLWKLALEASPDSFGLIPASFLPSALPSSSSNVSQDFSEPNSLEDIMPPDWKTYNYTLANFDSVLLSAYAKLKQLYPGTYVNVLNGKRVNSWCGLRSPACTIGAAQSAHKVGKALDMHHPSKREELRAFCESAEGLKLGIKRLEHKDATPTWVHIDVNPPNATNWKDQTKPYVFRP